MRYFLAFLICTTLLLTSCENDPLKSVDVSEEKIDFKSSRFDQKLFNVDFSNALAARQQLYQEYGEFLCDYMEVILQVAPCTPDSTFLALRPFVQHPNMSALEMEINKVHTAEEITKYDEGFADALKHWHHYFPDSIVPNVVYMNSGLNFSAYSTDKNIGVGLDFFLGANDSITNLLPVDLFPNYFKEDMDPQFVVVNSVKDFCWHQCNKNGGNLPNSDLLNVIIQQGKVMYLLDALVPEVEDSTKMNWRKDQLEWAQKNEFKVWKEIAKQEVLFNKDGVQNLKWIDFGPFTNVEAVPQDSPPQLGIWVGWNIVRAYMKQHKEVTLSDLIKDKDMQKILAAYKPSH
jgi:hypothetical protein